MPSLREETLRLAQRHHELMARCLPMEAGENVTSPSVRLALTSDFGHRYVGAAWSSSCYGTYTEIERSLKEAFCRLSGAEFVELRALSGMVANWIAFMALTRPGDTIMGLRSAHGGHRSVLGSSLAGARGLTFQPIPFSAETMQIDLEAAAEKMEAVKPRMVMVGANIFLFPYPLEELAEAARRVGAVLVYDAAMVLGLILGGHFQNPLAGGANVVTASTHKTFPGPQGGILFGKGEFGDRIEEASRSCFSNFHPHRILGVAVALAEMEAFGDTYAAQTVANAKTLASALCAKGMDVLCEGSGFTQTHQVVADCSAIGGAEKASAVLSQANIITSPFQIPRDDGTDNVSGLVLGTAEVTRLGMGESEMVEIARCIHRMVTGKSAPHRARAEVAELREPFQKIDYCFDEERQAYEYFGTEAGKT